MAITLLQFGLFGSKHHIQIRSVSTLGKYSKYKVVSQWMPNGIENTYISDSKGNSIRSNAFVDKTQYSAVVQKAC